MDGLPGQTGDPAALAPSAGRAPPDVHAPARWSATIRVVAANADRAARPREPALGIQTYCRRAQGSGHHRLRDLGAEGAARARSSASAGTERFVVACVPASAGGEHARDRKSTRLNSSHEWIAYAVFCLK